MLLHISSLPSPYGIGDFGEAACGFADFLGRTGQRFWQVLPLNPTDPACGNSPYFSCSTFAMNPLFISLEGLLENGLISRGDLETLPPFGQNRVDYLRVGAFKGVLLEKAFRKFRQGPVDDDYAAFCSEHSEWLDDFAIFTALKTEFRGRVWSEWPEGLRDRRPDALKEAMERLKTRVEKEKFLQ